MANKKNTSETDGDWKRMKKVQHPDGTIVDGHGTIINREGKSAGAGKGSHMRIGGNPKAYFESDLWKNMGPDSK